MQAAISMQVGLLSFPVPLQWSTSQYLPGFCLTGGLQGADDGLRSAVVLVAGAGHVGGGPGGPGRGRGGEGAVVEQAAPREDGPDAAALAHPVARVADQPRCTTATVSGSLPVLLFFRVCFGLLSSSGFFLFLFFSFFWVSCNYLGGKTVAVSLRQQGKGICWVKVLLPWPTQLPA